MPSSDMPFVSLGRTKLRTSALGLGGGGHSRLGLRQGAEEDNSIAIVHRALDLGVNFIDTAESYGTEPLIGKAIRGRRERVILSTKKTMKGAHGKLRPEELVAGLEGSLRNLGTDHVDIYHLHGLKLQDYDHAMEHLVPAMMKLRDQGKIRFLGVTEAFGSDTSHEMFARAMRDDWVDVLMVGFNILNQSARDIVLAPAIQKNIGVLCMFAVRVALSKPEKLRETIQQLIGKGEIDPADINSDSPLDFVLGDGAAESVPDAAYRFCRAEPGIHVVLSGTGNIRHLEENIESIKRAPLPKDVQERLMSMFEGVNSVSGQ